MKNYGACVWCGDRDFVLCIPHCNCFPLEGYTWWVSSGHRDGSNNLVNALKMLANQQNDGDSPIECIVTGLHEKSRKGIMDQLRDFIEVDNHSAVGWRWLPSRCQTSWGEEAAVQRGFTRGGYQRRRRRTDSASWRSGFVANMCCSPSSSSSLIRRSQQAARELWVLSVVLRTACLLSRRMVSTVWRISCCVPVRIMRAVRSCKNPHTRWSCVRWLSHVIFRWTCCTSVRSERSFSGVFLACGQWSTVAVFF